MPDYLFLYTKSSFHAGVVVLLPNIKGHMWLHAWDAANKNCLQHGNTLFTTKVVSVAPVYYIQHVVVIIFGTTTTIIKTIIWITFIIYNF